MPVNAVLFRFRFWVLAAIFIMGFVAPWDRWLALDGREKTWLALAEWLWRNGWLGLNAATIAVLLAGIVSAIAAAGLRTWATAYLGGNVVQSKRLLAGSEVVADGPYRYLRNPLYLGVWLHALALAVLMPPGGAAFAIVATAAFVLALIRGEESFLIGKLGAPYAEYKKLVPPLVPALAPRVKPRGLTPRWPQAVTAEVYMWGVALSFGVLGWRYNAHLLTKCVLVSLGVSLVARAFSFENRPQPAPDG